MVVIILNFRIVLQIVISSRDVIMVEGTYVTVVTVQVFCNGYFLGRLLEWVSNISLFFSLKHHTHQPPKYSMSVSLLILWLAFCHLENEKEYLNHEREFDTFLSESLYAGEPGLLRVRCVQVAGLGDGVEHAALLALPPLGRGGQHAALGAALPPLGEGQPEQGRVWNWEAGYCSSILWKLQIFFGIKIFLLCYDFSTGVVHCKCWF